MKTPSLAILEGRWTEALVAKALTDGYAKHIALGESELDEPGLVQFDILVASRFRLRSRVLQTLLVFDKLLLVDPDPRYDLTPLTDLGGIETLSADDEPRLLGYLGEGERNPEYAALVRPIVLNHLLSGIGPKERSEMALFGVKPRQFYSTLYDLTFGLDARLSPEANRKMGRYYDLRLRNEVSRGSLVRGGFGDAEARQMHSFGLFQGRFELAIGRIATLLELAVSRDGVLLQNDFYLSDLELDRGLWQQEKVSAMQSTYQLLRISLKEQIGSLPTMSRIDDVLTLRAQRPGELAGLRTVLGDVAEAVREGREAGLKRAMKEVQDASRSVVAGKRVARIGKWIAVLAVPMSIAEYWLGIPAFVSGFAMAPIGAGATLVGDIAEAKGRWTLVVR